MASSPLTRPLPPPTGSPRKPPARRRVQHRTARARAARLQGGAAGRGDLARADPRLPAAAQARQGHRRPAASAPPSRTPPLGGQTQASCCSTPRARRLRAAPGARAEGRSGPGRHRDVRSPTSRRSEVDLARGDRAKLTFADGSDLRIEIRWVDPPERVAAPARRRPRDGPVHARHEHRARHLRDHPASSCGRRKRRGRRWRSAPSAS